MREIVLITGLICSGKSMVSEILRNHGYEVIDMDRMAKAAIQNEFRKKFWCAFDKDPCNLTQMSECRYFEDCYEDERKAFESELDEYLSERINYLTNTFSLNTSSRDALSPLCIECPAVLPERFSNFIQKFKWQIRKVILVRVDDDIRMDRAAKRNIKLFDLRTRLEHQSEEIPLDKKLITVIENNGTFAGLVNKVNQLDLDKR